MRGSFPTPILLPSHPYLHQSPHPPSSGPLPKSPSVFLSIPFSPQPFLPPSNLILQQLRVSPHLRRLRLRLTALLGDEGSHGVTQPVMGRVETGTGVKTKGRDCYRKQCE